MTRRRTDALNKCQRRRPYGGQHGGGYQNGMNGGGPGYDERGYSGRGGGGGLADGGTDVDIDASIEATDLADL